MNTDHDQHDQHDALERILAAMRDAAPPEGMEARIAQRLQQHAAAPSAAPFQWRGTFENSGRISEWWRGAITGAAAVLLLTAASLLAGHLLQSHRIACRWHKTPLPTTSSRPPPRPYPTLPTG